jgi:aspartyl-tRNA(Asn)/glutamyl-tRNA(Gln) amidotransferase subunit B
MTNIYDKYEPVIGLEVHVQLNTKSKAYSSDEVGFGNLPNTTISPITLGHPGTLPYPNKKVIEYAIRLGIACECDIREVNEYARKNYFYADLPKGYQITQDKTPICTGGFVRIKQEDGSYKKINLTRIHMEEDAGKSIHDQDPFDSLIDLNRAGVALLEVVSEPEIRKPEEAYQYVTEIRKLVQYLEICDGNMEEGSLRCDANISVMKKGSKTFGTKVEVKNMNSIRNVQRAIEFEIARQIEMIENEEEISQETRSYDAVNNVTFSLRSKEAANDYRYFPEPDLQPVLIGKEAILEVKSQLPPLPYQLIQKYTKEFGLSDYDAGVLTDEKEIALYFEELTGFVKNKKSATNWMIGPVKSYLNLNALSIDKYPLKAEKLAELINLVEEGKVSYSAASNNIYKALIENPSQNPFEIAKEQNLIQDSNSENLLPLIETVLNSFPEKVIEYRSGKKGLIGLFMGEVMKLSKGKADPKLTNQLLQEKLNQ